MAVVDTCAQPRTCGQHGGDPAELLRQVEAGDAAAELVRQVARRPADARAHVEDVHARREPGQAGELGRRLAAANVELVHGGEVCRRQRLGIEAGFGQGGEDDFTEIAARVVGLD